MNTGVKQQLQILGKDGKPIWEANLEEIADMSDPGKSSGPPARAEIKRLDHTMCRCWQAPYRCPNLAWTEQGWGSERPSCLR